MAAQVVTLTENTTPHGIDIIKWDWLCTDLGAVSSTTARGYTGFIVRAVFFPDAAATQPTDQYDVEIVDAYGNVLNGLGANLSNAATVQKTQADGLLPVCESTLTLSITNAGNAKGGIVTLFILPILSAS